MTRYQDFEIHPCIEYTHKGEKFIERLSADDILNGFEPDFWTLYGIPEHGGSESIADFKTEYDAIVASRAIK